MKHDVFVVGGARTPIGSFGRSLRETPVTALGTLVARAALERAKVPADAVEHVVMGNVIPTEPRDAFLCRITAMDAGIPKETPAFNVNLSESASFPVPSSRHNTSGSDLRVRRLHRALSPH